MLNGAYGRFPGPGGRDGGRGLSRTEWAIRSDVGSGVGSLLPMDGVNTCGRARLRNKFNFKATPKHKTRVEALTCNIILN